MVSTVSHASQGARTSTVGMQRTLCTTPGQSQERSSLCIAVFLLSMHKPFLLKIQKPKRTEKTKKQLDDGWPESAEDHVTLVLL